MRWLVRGLVLMTAAAFVAFVAGLSVDLYSLAVVALCVLAPAAMVGSLAVAFTLEKHDFKRTPTTSHPQRIQHVTRLALSTGGFAIFATFVFGGLPFAASLLVAAGVALVLAPASLVYRWPGRGAAVMWSSWSALVAVLVGLIVTLDGDHITVALCFPVAALLTILVVVLPTIALLSSNEPLLPRARLQ